MKYKIWHKYFSRNRIHFDHINWDDSYRLSTFEKDLITASIQQFQLGEHSEGKHFLRYANQLNDPSYTESVKLFIKEEQDHAAVLGKFMDAQGIARVKDDSLDSIFRILRKLAGIEVTVTVLLTAEIMAFPFYKALARCTTSHVLQQICDQILIDEEMHIRFQSYTLQQIYSGKSKFGILCSRILHRLLMLGTIIMVWMWHRKVLRHGGYSFLELFGESRYYFRRCEEMAGQQCKVVPFFRRKTASAANLGRQS